MNDSLHFSLTIKRLGMNLLSVVCHAQGRVAGPQHKSSHTGEQGKVLGDLVVVPK